MSERQVVLIVDDDPGIRIVLADTLDLGGYETVAATNAQDAINLARSEQPSLILMDLKMPGMGGAEAIDILKDDPATQHIPIIALSAGNVLLDHVGQLRADSVIGKPFDVDVLLAGVALQLQHASVQATSPQTSKTGTGRLSPVPDGAEPAEHQLRRLVGDGRVCQCETQLATARYHLHLRTEMFRVGDDEVVGETTVSGAITVDDEVLLPAMTQLMLHLDDGQVLPFMTTGDGPTYAVLALGGLR